MHCKQPTHASHGRQYSEGLRLKCHLYFFWSFQLYYFNSRLGPLSFLMSMPFRYVEKCCSSTTSFKNFWHTVEPASFSAHVFHCFNQRGFSIRTSVIDGFCFCMKSQQSTTGFAETCRYESNPLKTYSTLAQKEESYQDPCRRS